jgi:hypothetical protein
LPQPFILGGIDDDDGGLAVLGDGLRRAASTTAEN